MKNNALAELAERLNAHITPIAGCVGSAQCGRAIADDVRKAQHIVAELADVYSTYRADPVHLNFCLLATDALSNCREIAEEGEKRK